MENNLSMMIWKISQIIEQNLLSSLGRYGGN